MRFLVIGGSGRTGQLVVNEALQRGHSVTALVRKEGSIVARPNLTIVKGSPLEPADLAVAFTSGGPIDGVVMTLGLARASDSPFAAMVPGAPLDLGAKTVTNLLKVMGEYGVRKLVVLSAQGTGSSLAQMSVLHRALFSCSNMKLQYADHNEVDRIVRSAAEKGQADFTLARPVMLAEGEAQEVKDWGDDGKGSGFIPKITRKSVARFLIEAAEGKEFNGRSPVISN